MTSISAAETHEQFLQRLDKEFREDPHNPNTRDDCFNSSCLVYYYDNQIDGFIQFEGNHHCSDDCRGWDAINGRCECGNRRVSFESDEYGDITAVAH